MSSASQQFAEFVEANVVSSCELFSICSNLFAIQYPFARLVGHPKRIVLRVQKALDPVWNSSVQSSKRAFAFRDFRGDRSGVHFNFQFRIVLPKVFHFDRELVFVFELLMTSAG